MLQGIKTQEAVGNPSIVQQGQLSDAKTEAQVEEEVEVIRHLTGITKVYRTKLMRTKEDHEDKASS